MVKAIGLDPVLMNGLKVRSCIGFIWVGPEPVNPSKVRSCAGFIEESGLDEFIEKSDATGLNEFIEKSAAVGLDEFIEKYVTGLLEFLLMKG